MLKNHEILIISLNNDYTVDIFQGSDIDITYSYGIYNNIFLKGIRKVWGKINLPCFDFWFAFKKCNIEKYKLIILYECIYPDRIIKYIRERNKKCKIVYWLWNTLKKIDGGPLYNLQKKILELYKEKNNEEYKCDIWSFDKNDCKRYGFKYNNQVSYKINLNKVKIEYDFLFCGKDKNRLGILKSIMGRFTEYLYKIMILPDKNKSYEDDDKKYFLKEQIPYPKLVYCINQSKCIIDIVQNGQGGLTWRPLEAMFYKKKLLTNFKDIISYDFYNKNNIFILGVDDLDKLDEFLQLPYQDISNEIIKKYQADGWLNNFIKGYTK